MKIFLVVLIWILLVGSAQFGQAAEVRMDVDEFKNLVVGVRTLKEEKQFHQQRGELLSKQVREYERLQGLAREERKASQELIAATEAATQEALTLAQALKGENAQLVEQVRESYEMGWKLKATWAGLGVLMMFVLIALGLSFRGMFSRVVGREYERQSYSDPKTV